MLDFANSAQNNYVEGNADDSLHSDPDLSHHSFEELSLNSKFGGNRERRQQSVRISTNTNDNNKSENNFKRNKNKIKEVNRKFVIMSFPFK